MSRRRLSFITALVIAAILLLACCDLFDWEVVRDPLEGTSQPPRWLEAQNEQEE